MAEIVARQIPLRTLSETDIPHLTDIGASVIIKYNGNVNVARLESLRRNRAAAEKAEHGT